MMRKLPVVLKIFVFITAIIFCVPTIAKEVNSKQTRLIIRTQEPEGSTPGLKAANYIEVPFHFIMERRTLMGIKARVEAGENVQLSQTIVLGCY